MITRTLLLINLIFFSFISSQTYAAQKSCEKPIIFNVEVYDKKEDHTQAPKELEDLPCKAKSFEGKYFKIVTGISKTAISFNSSPEIIRKAATVYYNLTESRKYWIHKIQSSRVKSLPQITIRIEMAKPYSRVAHYRTKDSQFNNAFTIAAGKTPKRVPKHKQKEWGDEIWFGPKKLIDVKEELNTIGTNPVTQSLRYVETPLQNMVEGNFLNDTMAKIIEPEYNQHQTFEDILITNLTTIVAVKGIIWASEYLDYVFIQDYYYMDTALVPDVIQHEFAHIVLSDYLKTKSSTPVIEGMADYFVAAQNNRDELYQKVDDIIMIKPKNANNSDLYSPVRELKVNAMKDFVLSVLWKVRQKLNEANKVRLKTKKKKLVDIDKMIYETRKKLTLESKIFPDLIRALTDTCRKLCRNPRMGINAINQALEEKGF